MPVILGDKVSFFKGKKQDSTRILMIWRDFTDDSQTFKFDIITIAFNRAIDEHKATPFICNR